MSVINLKEVVNTNFAGTNFLETLDSFQFNNFANTRYLNCDFRGCMFSHMVLQNVVFDKCLFNDAIFHGVTFENVKFSSEDRSGPGIECDGLEFINCIFKDEIPVSQDMPLNGSKFAKSIKYENCTFSTTNTLCEYYYNRQEIFDLDLFIAYLKEVDAPVDFLDSYRRFDFKIFSTLFPIRESTLNNVQFNKYVGRIYACLSTNIQNITSIDSILSLHLDGAHLSDSQFITTKFVSSTYFRDVSIQRTVFDNCDLKDAYFAGVNTLTDTKFTNCVLWNFNYEKFNTGTLNLGNNVHFDDCDLWGANFNNLDLTNVKGLNTCNLDQVKYNAHTKWPVDFNKSILMDWMPTPYTL